MISKIVVPTDFSAAAKVGINYAVEFAKQCKAELIIFHVLPSLGPTLTPVAVAQIIETFAASAEDELKMLVHEVNSDDLAIKYHIAYDSSVENALEFFTKNHAIDLIIMSSKGATGLKRVLWGSNTVDVINKCHTPVVVVPEHVRICIPREFIYASDLINMKQEVHLLLPFAKALNASIKILHVLTNFDQEDLDTKVFISGLVRETSFRNIEIHVIKAEDIATTIKHNMLRRTQELLVIFTHSASFFEQLFNKSIAREIAWSHKVPMLIINNR